MKVLLIHLLGLFLFSTLIEAEGISDPSLKDTTWLEIFRSAHKPPMRWVEVWWEVRQEKLYADFLNDVDFAQNAWLKAKTPQAFIHFDLMECGSVGAVHTVGYLAIDAEKCVVVYDNPYQGAKPVRRVFETRSGKGKSKEIDVGKIRERISKVARYEFSPIDGSGGWLYLHLNVSYANSRREFLLGGSAKSVEGQRVNELLKLMNLDNR